MKVKSKQIMLLQDLAATFRQWDSVHAIITGGSLVERPDAVDAWSDVDIKLVIDEGAQDQFLGVASWTATLGEMIGVELFQHPEETTIRICLEGYQRIDLVLVPRTHPLVLRPSQKVLWKREDLLISEEDTEDVQPSFVLDNDDVMQKVNALWFQASVAIAKAVRNDHLIAYHLTLMVMQGVLELQMMRRDTVLDTNIHRNAGWGNDLISRFPQVDMTEGGKGILKTLQATCDLLDALADEMVEDYSPRLPLLEPEIEKAMGEV